MEIQSLPDIIRVCTVRQNNMNLQTMLYNTWSSWAYLPTSLSSVLRSMGGYGKTSPRKKMVYTNRVNLKKELIIKISNRKYLLQRDSYFTGMTSQKHPM